MNPEDLQEIKDFIRAMNKEGLRDKFAAAALTGIVMRGEGDVSDAFMWADMMLAEREKTPAPEPEPVKAEGIGACQDCGGGVSSSLGVHQCAAGQ